MKEQTQETVIEKFFKATLHLIIADMKGRKLIQAFTTIGLETSPYETNLYQDVFLLAGFATENQTEDLKDWYYRQIEKIQDVEITDINKIDEMAQEILMGLMEIKKGNKKLPKSQ